MADPRRPLPLILALVASLALAACGGDDDDGGDGGDEGEIMEVIEQAETTDDRANCTELVTQNFVEQSEFERGEQAVQNCEFAEEAGADPAESVEVSNISVEGDTATADASYEGGGLDGSTATLSLVKEGEQWKIDRIEGFPEFDRRAFEAAFRERQIREGLPADQADCIGGELADLSEDDLKELLLSGDESQLDSIFRACETP